MQLLKGNNKPSTLYVGNHIVNAKYNYSLIQERIFNYVLFELQEHISKVRNGTPVYQLDLFDENTSEIKVKILLKHISTPNEYDHIRESMQKMCTVLVQTEIRDKKGKSWQQWQGLFLKVSVPDGSQRSPFMLVTIDVSVAQMLLTVQRRPDGTPINFTTFMYEIAMNTRCKYTPRIYKLISSWKTKGGFYYSIEDLRELLQLEDKYKDSEALKRGVLGPVWKELKENADCWFNLAEKTFEVKEGNRVVGYNFKVISDKQNVNYRTQLDYLIYTLKTEYHLTTSHIDSMRYIIDDSNNWNTLHWRMSKVNLYLAEDKDLARSAVRTAAYVTRAIINQFKEG